MSAYHNTQGLEQFLDRLKECPEVSKELKSDGHESFDNFSSDEVFDYVEDIISNNGEHEDYIEALGAYEDIFHVNILSFAGTVYWITANEFDDIKYFSTKKDAVEYAHDEFSSYIGGLVDLREREEDDG